MRLISLRGNFVSVSLYIQFSLFYCVPIASNFRHADTKSITPRALFNTYLIFINPPQLAYQVFFSFIYK